MPQIIKQDDIAVLGTILGVWAHPDDETYSMAGIMAAAVSNGQTVVLITATRGEKGIQDESRWPADQLADIRSQEMNEALKVLGVKPHHWLDYGDGECDRVDMDTAAARVAELIRQYNPDSIFTFGPDGMTGHADHITVSKWTSLAVQQTGSSAHIYHAVETESKYQAWQAADKELNVFFNIDKPNIAADEDCDIFFSLPDDIYDKKLAALKAMPSQTESMISRFGDSLRQSSGVETFIEVKKP